MKARFNFVFREFKHREAGKYTKEGKEIPYIEAYILKCDDVTDDGEVYELEFTIPTEETYLIYNFSKVTPTFVNGSIRKIERTNISYIEPHRVIVKNTTFLVFNYSNDVYISNLAKKIKLSELEDYIKVNWKSKFNLEKVTSSGRLKAI